MFAKKLFVRLSLILLLAGITTIGFAGKLKFSQDVKWHGPLYAGAKISTGDSTTCAVAKGESINKNIVKGKMTLNAYAPGGDDDPAPINNHPFNGVYNKRLTAWGHNNAGQHSADSSVSGEHKTYGDKWHATASK